MGCEDRIWRVSGRSGDDDKVEDEDNINNMKATIADGSDNDSNRSNEDKNPAAAENEIEAVAMLVQKAAIINSVVVAVAAAVVLEMAMFKIA